MASVAEIKSCLTCKKQISGVPICLDSSDPDDNISNRQKLKILVPEWDLGKNKVYICTSCSCKLSTSYKFRMMCLSAASTNNVDPAVAVKIEPEEIDDTSTKNSNLRIVHPPVAVDELVAVTADVQKSNVIVAVKSKLPVEVHKQASNKNIKKRNSPTLILPKPVDGVFKTIVAVDKPATGDVQKPNVLIAVRSKSAAEVEKQTANKNSQKPTSPIIIQSNKPVDKQATGDVQKPNSMFAVKSKYAFEVDKQTSNKNIQKPSSPIAILPKTMAAFFKSSQNSNMQKMIQIVGSKPVPKVHSNKQNLLGNMRKAYAAKTSVEIKPKQVTGIAQNALPINMDMDMNTPIKPMEIGDKVTSNTQEKHFDELGPKVTANQVNKPVINGDSRKTLEGKLDYPVTATSIIATKSSDSPENMIIDPPDIKIEDCQTELDEQRTARKLIMKTLYKAVLDAKESGVSPPKRQFTSNLYEPETNLSETIMQNWNTLSLLVRNELNCSTTSVEKEADASPEVNRLPEISETPPEVNVVKEPLEVNAPVEANKPAEVSELDEVKTEVIEIKSESDDVEFVSEIFLEPSTSKSTLKNKASKGHEQDQQQRSQDIDLSMKSKTTFLCKCNHCGLLLTSKETLVKHIRQHFKNNPVQCDQCKTQFGDISSYNAHTCIYDKGKKAVVSEFEPECPKPKECKCNLYFGNIRTLNIHLETTCENSMFCMTCNMGFADPISMDCHLRNVHNLFLCNLCRKMFRDKKYLMTHLHMMHEKKTANKKIKYRCPFKSCKKSFKFYDTYELHLTYKHQEYYSNIYWEDCKTSYMTYMCNLCKNHDKPACLNLLDQSAFIVQLQKNHAL